jgi:mono/diheme cytochrome c family protein
VPLLLSAAAAGSLAQTAPATAPAGPSIEAGRKVYVSSCTRCHGINLVVSSSAFYDLRTFPSGEKERFVRSVSKGIRAMPAWEGTLSPEQIESLWLYIGSVNGWSP